MATIYKVPVTTVGPNVSKLRKLTKVDRRESAGTLALFAPGHPAMAAAPPAFGAAAANVVMPNLFLAQAKLLIPAGNDANLQANMQQSTNFANLTKGKLEYTGKKGIHGIVSKASPMAGGDGAKIQFHTALLDYFYANKSHNFYTSFWTQVTRTAGTSYTTSLLDFGAGSTSNDYGHFVHSSLGSGNWTTNLTAPGYTGTNYNTLGGANRRYNAGAGKSVMVATALSTIQNNWGAPASSYNAAVVANNGGILPSYIFYELFVEDLTVSGRTWQEVDAIDKSEFDKAFAVGGRYYGDTFTDPATLA
jgi:hypothetical protein